MKGKLGKISKSSFERPQYHCSSNDANLLGHYLAGLIEGDGSIIVPKTIRNQKGKLLYPVVKITFVEKDAPLAMKIKQSLNGGTLVYPKDYIYLDLLFQYLNSKILTNYLYTGRFGFYLLTLITPLTSPGSVHIVVY